MPPILRTVLAIIVGALVGGAINMGLVNLGMSILPIEGLDLSNDNPEAFIEYGDFLKNEATFNYFIFPYLAHALGTLLGALLAYLIAAPGHKKAAAFVIGGFYLLGGIAASSMIPGPTWFAAVDILTAYIPMGWLATIIGKKVQGADVAVLDNSTVLDS